MKAAAALLALTLIAAAPESGTKSTVSNNAASVKTLSEKSKAVRATEPASAVSSSAPTSLSPSAPAWPFAHAKKSSTARAPAISQRDAGTADVEAPAGQKPIWDVARVTPGAVDVVASTYVVQPGDTLSAVVRKTGAGADAIADRNDLKPPFVVRAGQKLKIPAGRFHTVLKGQSGIAIARAYGVEWLRIVELNHLEEPFSLREGQRLLLPAATEVAKMSLEQRAAAFTIDLADLATGSEPAVAPKAQPVIATPSPPHTLSPTTAVAEPVIAFAGRLAWPLQGRIIRPYGPMPTGGRNDGINIAAPFGTAIQAAADGAVMWVGQHPAFGNVVLVRHGSGWITIYGNADKLLVKRGQSVKIGQTIGRVGLSGSTADQPQLFFEVLQGRKPVNPMNLLPRRDRDADQSRDTAPSQQ